MIPRSRLTLQDVAGSGQPCLSLASICQQWTCLVSVVDNQSPCIPITGSLRGSCICSTQPESQPNLDNDKLYLQWKVCRFDPSGLCTFETWRSMLPGQLSCFALFVLEACTRLHRLRHFGLLADLQLARAARVTSPHLRPPPPPPKRSLSVIVTNSISVRVEFPS